MCRGGVLDGAFETRLNDKGSHRVHGGSSASRTCGGSVTLTLTLTLTLTYMSVPAEVRVGDEEHIMVVSIELGNIIDRHLCRL